MGCASCGAPLPPKSTVCRYCGRRNEVDLRGIRASQEQGPRTDLNCPRCEGTKLHSLHLAVADGLAVERCNSCHGIFFDPDELEYLLDASISHVYEVDFARIENILLEDGEPNSWPVGYIKCPRCTKHMNRSNYGARSGVIIDSCKVCGIWLDGGELRKILAWAKAGGRIHNENSEKDKERMRKQAEASLEAQQFKFGKDVFDGAEEESVIKVLLTLFNNL